MVAALLIATLEPAFGASCADRAHAEHAGGPAVDRKAAAGHGAGGAGGLLVGETGSSPTRSTFGGTSIRCTGF